jgi:hypothetical protein
MNRIVRFPELYEARISVYAPDSGAYASKFYFLEHLGDVGNVLRAGPHAIDCSYASADLCFAGFTFRIEYAAGKDGGLACSLTPIAVADPFTLVLVEVLRAWNLDGAVELEDDGVISFPCDSGGRIRIAGMQDTCSVHNPGTPITSGVYPSEEAFLQSLSERKTLSGLGGKGGFAAIGFNARVPLKIAAWVEKTQESVSQCKLVPHEITVRTREAKGRQEEASPAITGGPFEGCYRAVISVMNWMTVWDQLHGIPYTPVSRSWIDNYMVRMGFDRSVRGPLTGLWDSFFHAILHSINDQQLAEANIRVVLDDYALTEEGYPPNYMVSGFMSGDRSQPPLGAFAVWKLYRRFGNKELLEWVYPRLRRWRLWWKNRRDGNADGLLEWGSNLDAKKPGNDAGTLFAAKCESGMDNSPLYDEADYDQATGTMNLSDVGLNSLYAADAMFLSNIAGELGKVGDKEALEMEHKALTERINSELWDRRAKSYRDKYWNGDFSSRMGPTALYPLLARIPDADRADELVRRHLLNESEFWGEFVIPTISRNDPAFMDQLYWRGRIWPPVNYLVYLGLKAYRLDETAYELARRSVRLFMQEWQLRGHCHENYNTLTGEGDDVPIAASPGSNGSDRFYPWGALLAFMGIEELFDVETDKGIRLGCRFLREESRVSNIPFDGGLYTVNASSEETRASRDDSEFFFSRPGTSVRNYVSTGCDVEFAAAGTGDTLFRVSEFAPSAFVVVHVGDCEPHRTRSDERGAVSFRAEMSSLYTQVALRSEVGESSPQRPEYTEGY